MTDTQKKEVLPVLAIKNNVLFPHALMPIVVGRPRSVAAIEAALATEEKELFVVTQRDPDTESPQLEDLFKVGTKAVLKKVARPQPNAIEAIVQGIERAEILELTEQDPCFKARVELAPPINEQTTEVEALHREVMDRLRSVLSLSIPEGGGALQLSESLQDPVQLMYLAAAMLPLDTAKEQELLEAKSVTDGLRLLNSLLGKEIEVLKLRKEIAGQARSEISKAQREHFLRQQLRAIKAELGETDPTEAEIQLLRDRVDSSELPEEVRTELRREIEHLERLPPAAPDYNVTRTYLELALELPWKKSTTDQLEIERARRVLDEDHHDLEEVKERILEHLAVLRLNPQAESPILCFVGPPGTGKTSLGQSIARALERKFERLSLGGLHDEAELRGHRRTYVGAMPGRILQAVRRAGVNNPVLMLDEVDKLGRDFRGDPAAALLEILDPEQNRAFHDNYLDLAFDLSRVFFITTANALETVPGPLLDRMEVLRLAGYTEEEKLEIAKKYLVPRQRRQSGLREDQLVLPDDTLVRVIRRYTKEAGLRQLERAIGRIARKIALRITEGESPGITIKTDDLSEILGPELFFLEEARKELPPGVATGLAWTEAGGVVLYVETMLRRGDKGLTLTGQLGEVMQESARAAQSYLWSSADRLGIDEARISSSGIHIHIPAGAVPKDGPSAGVTLAVALASLYTGQPVRSDTAMTGEITLTGLVLPVGGVKEKVLAARRAGIKRVVLPKENRKDLPDIPESIRSELEFIFVETVDDVLLDVVPALPVSR